MDPSLKAIILTAVASLGVDSRQVVLSAMAEVIPYRELRLQILVESDKLTILVILLSWIFSQIKEVSSTLFPSYMYSHQNISLLSVFITQESKSSLHQT